MSKNYYRLYVEGVIALAQTLCIKSEHSAETLNSYIRTKYGNDGVDDNDPTTWKYYLNICGEYHYDDDIIYVTSLDTLQTIPFTKEALVTHKATARAYQYNTRYYRELVSLNPNSEQLILGVLYPATMSEAVSKENGSILSYCPDYIENNEEQLLHELEIWIKKFNLRWSNKQFAISDSLYSASQHAILYLNLVPAILNIRTKACKTPHAHSFHVREYLASHGMLDVYLSNMTQKQALFFYRNIAYIERNSGKQHIFKWLIENVLTDRGIPIAEYIMRHDVSSMPDSYYADPTFRKRLLNLTSSVIEEEIIDINEILTKESDLVVGNPDYIAEHGTAIDTAFKNSLSSVVKTKVLESSVVSYTNSYGQSLESILLSHWLYLSSLNLYNVYATVKNPRTGNDIILSTKDAFIYSFYCFCKAIKSTLPTIPSFIAQRVQLIPTPTTDVLMSLVDSKVVDISIAQAIISYQPLLGNIDSIDNFYLKCKDIRDATRKQARLVSNQQNILNRSFTQNMVLRMYGDKVCVLAPANTSYDAWIAERELPTTAFTQEEYYEIYSGLVASATGADLNDAQTLENIQKAMIDMMAQLSSYSIQYIRDIVGINVENLNWASIRVDDPLTVTSDHSNLNDVGCEVISQAIGVNDRVILNVDLDKSITISKSDHANIEIKTKVHTSSNFLDKPINIDIGRLMINRDFVDANSVTGVPRYITGYETFDSLTDAEKLRITDVYCKCVEEIGPRKISLSDTILVREIGGFQYHSTKNTRLDGFVYRSMPYFSGGSFTTTFTDDELNAFYSSFGSTAIPGFKSTGGISVFRDFSYVAPP